MISPGPWRWDWDDTSGGDVPHSLTAAGNRGLAVYYEPGRASTDEDYANLRLLEAAPELLAALEAMIDATSKDDWRVDDARKAARSLIARIRGPVCPHCGPGHVGGSDCEWREDARIKGK